MAFWCGVLGVVVLAISCAIIRRRKAAGLAGLLVASGLFLIAMAGRRGQDIGEVDLAATEVRPRIPRTSTRDGYVSSKACVECHADEHASWRGSYHRTMTQAVTPETMAAPAKKTVLTSRGREFRFIPDGDRFLAETVDPEWDADHFRSGLIDYVPGEKTPYVRRQIVMSTGSHHYQTFWVNGTNGNLLWRLPWVYHIEMQRWMPSQDTFIMPPRNLRVVQSWHNNCIPCHAVAGKEEVGVSGFINTQVAELGIACEACHGPGAEHVAHQTKLRDAAEVSSEIDTTIVNPARLAHERSSEVCGQCHGMLDFKGRKEHGMRFRPGQILGEVFPPIRFEEEAVKATPDLADSFWNDGTMRVAGRDFSGLERSACYEEGEISCISCHSLHRYEEASDQLAPEMRTDQACLQCHEDFGADISAHTHHAAESTGSRCTNCHMPHTTLGLLKAIRSHRIDIPTTAMTAEHGRPNACVLCHVDKPMPWVDERLVAWYGHSPSEVELPGDVPPAVALMLSGDAVQRAVLAWNFGREETRAASGDDWQLPVLAELLNDPYSVVRAIAWRAIKNYPDAKSFQYDFLASEKERLNAKQELIALWRRKLSERSMPERSADERTLLMQTAKGERDDAALKKLTGRRDDRPINFAE